MGFLLFLKPLNCSVKLAPCFPAEETNNCDSESQLTKTHHVTLNVSLTSGVIYQQYLKHRNQNCNYYSVISKETMGRYSSFQDKAEP